METKKIDTTTTIQEELNQLWKTQSNGNKLRACLFNLIVYTHEPRRTAYFQEVIKMIMEQFPCHVIFIQGTPESTENSLHVQVSTKKGQDERKIACDQILIEAKGEDLKRIPFLILPLFIPDLPIYLLWGQDPTKETTILPHLQRFATRLIFDSEATDNLQHFSQYILDRLTTDLTPIVDMNWARIGGWREVLGQTFDSPERFDQLTTADSIKISFNNIPNPFFTHSESQALYLQAWLASRLGWQFVEAKKESDKLTLKYQTIQGQHIFYLVPINQPLFEPEEVLKLEILGQNDYQCEMNRKDNDQIEVHACNQSQCELPFTILMPSIKTGRSFMQEIFYQNVSDHYCCMLKMIRSIQWS